MIPALLVLFCSIAIASMLWYRHWRQRSEASSASYQTKISSLESELTQLKVQLQASSLDTVTNLPGWKVFEDRLHQALQEAKRHQLILGVMYVDIDDFRLINSAMGFEMGDAVLSETAARLQTCLRQVDSISRQSKDTFVILLAQLAKQETVAIVIQRILQAMSEPYLINDKEASITACIGVALFPQDGTTSEELLHHAEYAVMQAKEMGKHTYQFHQASLLTNSQRELEIYNSISSETFLNELQLRYLSVMNVAESQLSLLEAEVVWVHPSLGEITSDELMAAADKHRKLNKMTEWMLVNASRDFLARRAAGAHIEKLGIPVWLKQLEHVQFVYRVSQILQELQMDAKCIVFAVRESEAPVSLDILEKSFNMLDYLGIKIAINHFGTAGFSLRSLKVLSLQYVQLDPAMIDDVVESEQTRAIIKAVVSFANNLSADVVATGVQTDEQIQTLRQLGIGLMQGEVVSELLSDREIV